MANSPTEFFKNLAGFDTETTGTKASTSRIWQTGFVGEGVAAEEVVNPFFMLDNNGQLVPEVMNNKTFKQRLTDVNGVFSQEAMGRGDFNMMIDLHSQGLLSNSLDQAIDRTLGSMSPNAVLILQNMKFENKFINKGVEEGSISQPTIQRIRDRMQYLQVEADGHPGSVLQIPTSVERYTRIAQRIAQKELSNKSTNHRSFDASFKRYVDAQHHIVNSYRDEIQKRTKAIVVEQMDITKALYGIAASKGYLDKNNVTLGLNMDFLTSVLLDRPEKHLALSDSKDTVEVFEKTWTMIEELQIGKVSQQTTDYLSKIRTAQEGVIVPQFMKAVQGVIGDLDSSDTNFKTNYSRAGSYSVKEKYIRDTVTGDIDKLPSAGRWSPGTESIDTALENVLSRYRKYPAYIGSLQKYADDIKVIYKDTANYADRQLKIEEATANFKLSDLKIGTATSTVNPFNYWNEEVTLFGKEMQRKTKFGILGTLGATLGTMALTRSPEPEERLPSSVSEEFYDDQYLGTQFVNFRERNKHYMY